MLKIAAALKQKVRLQLPRNTGPLGESDLASFAGRPATFASKTCTCLDFLEEKLLLLWKAQNPSFS